MISNGVESFLRIVKRFIPTPIFNALQSPYHYLLAVGSVLWHRFPSKKLCVVGITGTKGKTTTAELINAILEEAGYKTALLSTIHFKIGSRDRRNLFKMTMPGRFFVQRFLRDAVDADCTHAILEMTSEGVALHRHRFIDLNALLFTNIAKEHIESHGSFENYLAAKLKLRDSLERSGKSAKLAVANTDDQHGQKFLNVPSATGIPFGLKNAEPYRTTDQGVLLTVGGSNMFSPLLGLFNIYNILGAVMLTERLGVSLETIKKAIEGFSTILGRVEHIEAGQEFTVIVDYAHTPESQTGLYETFEGRAGKKICVLGNTGGGRDKWKRPAMGAIADQYCDLIILTNEDPYDEDPRAIVDEMKTGFKKHTPEIIMNRRAAIREAFSRAKKNDVVLISGKGTDPYICGPHGELLPWDDASVAREELERLNKRSE